MLNSPPAPCWLESAQLARPHRIHLVLKAFWHHSSFHFFQIPIYHILLFVLKAFRHHRSRHCTEIKFRLIKENLTRFTTMFATPAVVDARKIKRRCYHPGIVYREFPRQYLAIDESYDTDAESPAVARIARVVVPNLPHHVGSVHHIGGRQQYRISQKRCDQLAASRDRRRHSQAVQFHRGSL